MANSTYTTSCPHCGGDGSVGPDPAVMTWKSTTCPMCDGLGRILVDNEYADNQVPKLVISDVFPWEEQ